MERAFTYGARVMKKSIFLVSGFVLVYAGMGSLFHQEARRETFQEIKLQMTKSEVRGLLGGPLAEPNESRKLFWGGVEEFWIGKDGTILVVFNQKDVLTYKEWIEPEGTVYISRINE